MACDYTIRLYAPADALGVQEVLRATYGAQAPAQATYEWWAFGCPEATNGAMVAESDGRVVGMQPMEIFAFTDAGMTVKGGVLTGVTVHPDFRRQGIFSALIKACEQEAWRQDAEFVTTMPNERSRPGFHKMGYCDLGRRRFLIRPVDARDFGRKMAGPLSVLGAATGAAFGAVQAVAKRLPRVGESRVSEVRNVDEAIEEIEPIHNSFFPGLRMRRSAAWWRWRYLESPLRRYRLFEARADGQLAGVAATIKDERDGVTITYLMDAAVRTVAALQSLVAAVITSAKADGAQAVAAVVSAPAMVRSLRQSGFWVVPLWAPIKLFYSVARFNPARESQTPAAWRQIENWNQTLGDWDNL